MLFFPFYPLQLIVSVLTAALTDSIELLALHADTAQHCSDPAVSLDILDNMLQHFAVVGLAANID